jgi:hypothetical protein
MHSLRRYWNRRVGYFVWVCLEIWACLQISGHIGPSCLDDTSKDASEAKEKVAEKAWSSLHLIMIVDFDSSQEKKTRKRT